MCVGEYYGKDDIRIVNAWEPKFLDFVITSPLVRKRRRHEFDGLNRGCCPHTCVYGISNMHTRNAYKAAIP